MVKVIFLGAPGAGKGTIATIVSKDLGMPQIGTGDLLREEIKKESELGLKAKVYYDKGELVPDEIVIDMAKKRIQEPDCAKGLIFDGFPRTIAQAEALDKAMDIDKVVNFVVSDEIIVHRMSGRRICRDCNYVQNVNEDGFPQPKVEGKCDKCGGEIYQRDDDQPEAIKNRLNVYRKQTEPLINYYKEKGKLVDIDAGDTDVQKIVAEAKKVISE